MPERHRRPLDVRSLLPSEPVFAKTGRTYFGELPVCTDLRIHEGLAGRPPGHDLVCNRFWRFHARRTGRHTGDSDPRDILRLLGEEALDGGRGHVAFDEVRADLGRVTGEDRSGHPFVGGEVVVTLDTFGLN